jgi:Bifunctional DNA primase/polymerase, N-terminal/Primase C terminal 1 (PriCT-1)
MIPDCERSNTSNRSETLSNALQAAEAGRSVFPIHHKEPTTGGTPHGVLDASRNPASIHAMFNAARRPVTGFAIATGRPSGVIVVDVDGPEAVEEAKRLGLTSGYIVRSGRERDGFHIYFQVPGGVEVKGGPFGEHLRLQADGQYVCAPGSMHPSGRRYKVVKGGEPSPAPPQILSKAEKAREKPRPPHKARGAVSIDLSGPPIIAHQPGRNLELTSIGGRLHDGSRSLEELTRDLAEINEARCQPPLGLEEVKKIARSIHGRPPCNPAPEVTPWVRAAVDYLRSIERPIKGTGGSTGWAIYSALLDHACRYGREHEAGISLSVDYRSAAQLAGTNAGTVWRWISGTNLVSVLKKGQGRKATVFLLHVPSGFSAKDTNCNTPPSGGVRGDKRSPSVADNALRKTLYRMRWSGGATKRRLGVARGTRKVRQGHPTAGDGIKRLGKSKAAILWAVAECGAQISRAVLAERLGRKADSMRAALKYLVDAGLLLRVKRGIYAVPDDLARRLEDVRELGNEPRADRLQIAEHARQRAAYHRDDKTDRDPTEEEMRERRESFPVGRRTAIEHLLAQLFAERPEFKRRRVGQITCRIIRLVGPDFPRGQIGMPKDAEVEKILDGEPYRREAS